MGPVQPSAPAPAVNAGATARTDPTPVEDEWELDPDFDQGDLVSTLPRLGALERWRKALRAGGRGDPNRSSTWVLDNLWRAACKEAAALDLEAAGDLVGARHYFDW